MGAVDRGDQLREVVAGILARHTPGELYGFDLGPAFLATPNGMTGGYILTVSCRSPVLNPPRMAFTVPVPEPWPDDQALAAAVTQCLSGLAVIRRKLLQAPPPAAAPLAGGRLLAPVLRKRAR